MKREARGQGQSVGGEGGRFTNAKGQGQARAEQVHLKVKFRRK